MATKQTAFIRDATGLTRELSAWDALMYNVLNMGVAWPVLFIFWAASAYPGVDMPLTILIGLVPNLIIAFLFYYLSVAFPRTGGDYVWVSRLVHPALGFMETFGIVVFWLSFAGPVDGWFMTYGVSTMFRNLAIATGNQAYVGYATAALSQSSILISSLLVLAAVLLAAAFGLRNAFKFQWATFIIMMIGIVIFLGALATSSPTTFQTNFNQLSGANYDSLINSASNAGFVIDFTLAGTMIGTFYSFVNYIGFELSAYVGGEVKQAQRSQLIGIVGSIFVFAFITVLMFGLPYPIMGVHFLNSVWQLAATGNAAYTLPSPPVTSYLVIFANPSPIVAIGMPLAIMACVLGSQETVTLMAIRMLFSWSFDGVAPARLADLSERTRTPNYALAVVGIVSLVYILIANFAANVLTFLAYSTSGIYLSVAVVGLAGLLLPYKHKEFFTTAPAVVQRKLAGIPVIALLGGATFIIGVVVSVIAASPIFTGAPINPYYIAGIAGVFITGLVLYELSVLYHRNKGFDLSLRFKQIPPE